jgi:hypothetical protein
LALWTGSSKTERCEDEHGQRAVGRQAVAQTFYRIVKSAPPTLQDFMSFQELGKQPRNPDDPEVVRRGDKVSVWGEEQRAHQWARLHPRLGRYIARLDLPDASTVPAEASGPAGRYSLAATAEELRRYVTSVVPAAPAG